MQNLIYNNEIFYLSDEIGILNGKTHLIKDYTPGIISSTNMPHQYFNKNIVIYGRHTCPYCIGTLDNLKKNKELFKKVIFVEVDSKPNDLFNKTSLINSLNEDKTFIKGYSTFPMVFNNGKFIGGSSDTEKYFSK